MLRRICRAGLRRCPNCGQRGVFKSWGTMVEKCPGCALTYEREEGYWLGAVLINTVVTIGLFAVTMIAWGLATWPDPPWTAMTASGIVINLLVPLAFYPVSKTLWVALDLSLHPAVLR